LGNPWDNVFNNGKIFQASKTAGSSLQGSQGKGLSCNLCVTFLDTAVLGRLLNKLKMRYFGGKNLSGLYQWIINEIPLHEIYIEPFAGSAAIARLIRPGARKIVCEMSIPDPGIYEGLEIFEGCGIQFLKENNHLCGPRTFIYCDPPYLLETRKSGKRYKYEWDRKMHEEFLELILSIPAAIMISGYDSGLYNSMLPGWRKEERFCVTRSGALAKECIWMNYNEPALLHDCNYAGQNFTDRQRIKRKADRWVKNLMSMPDPERQRVFTEIAKAMTAANDYRIRK
jgi:DNA adenine methylase